MPCPEEICVRITPMLQQYLDAKEQHPECVVLFRMGDFYEVFLDDAKVVAEALDLTLTARGKEHGDPIPMAGVPYHAANGYIRRLVQLGHRVAICEQLEDPSKAKGIVRRGVTKVITPGVLLDDENLDGDANHFLLALAVSNVRRADITAVASVDVSTGELRVSEQPTQAALLDELRRLRPAEVLVTASQEALFTSLTNMLDTALTRRPDDATDLERLVRNASSSPLDTDERALQAMSLSTTDLRERLATLDGHVFRDRSAVNAAIAVLLDYLRATRGGVPAHIAPPTVVRSEDFLVLDPSTTANLEIFETLMGGKRQGSLISVIDKSVTNAGARRLRTWLAYPMTDVAHIRKRQSGVSELVDQLQRRTALRSTLQRTNDIQRLCSKLAAGQGNARDLVALRVTLESVPGVVADLKSLDSPALRTIRAGLDPCKDLRTLIGRAILDEPAAGLTEGGMIARGYNAELDRLDEIMLNGKQWVLNLEQSERKATKISSLKVRFNKNFGYFIEITKANLESVPKHYIRKQTLTNAERYFTPELKEFEETLLDAESRRSELEFELFEEIRREAVAHLGRLRTTAEHLAELDAMAALAELGHRGAYVAPQIRDEPGISIQGGRHPVVETMVDSGAFIPNDVALSDDARLQIITGPNMAGKSTVIRQVALITLLAQIGSHVPADSAEIGVVDQIFSRVGASDNLARGQSTFMVEMSETAHILRNATSRSLVILDEIGRGTATYDGLSIAWSVAEYLHDTLRPFTLFATHYHELTDLSRTHERVRNFNIAAREYNDEIIFLHKLVEGPASRSYGIQVARLAGIPDPVVARARAILTDLESDTWSTEAGRRHRSRGASDPPPQLSLFDVGVAPSPRPLSPWIRELATIDIDNITPMQALSSLSGLRERAKSEIRELEGGAPRDGEAKG